jgi:hypothetical protein
MSPTAFGVLLGVGVTVAGAAALVEGDEVGLELMTAVGRVGPQAIRAKARMASRNLIVA